MKSKSRRNVLGLVLFSAAVAGASTVRADMGSVWVEEIEPTSVTLVWSDPSIPHQLATDIGTYRVSWKHLGSPYSLYPNERIVTGSPRAEVDGLSPDTVYEFRVETYAEKIIEGKWRNAKYRQVGIVRQNTRQDFVLRLANSTTTALAVEFTNNSGEIFDRVRFAYKVKWSPSVDLNATVARSYGPEECWQDADGQFANDSQRGKKDKQPFEGQRDITLTFSGLSPLTEYEIVVYGFVFDQSQKLGQIRGKTAGYHPFQTPAACVAADHPDVLDRYGELITDYPYGQSSLFDMVRGDLPEFAGIECLAPEPSIDYPGGPDALREFILADEGDDLHDNLTLLRYLVANLPDVFEALAQRTGVDLSRGDEDLFASGLIEIGEDVSWFLRSDCNADGQVDITDAITALGALFLGTDEPTCRDACDSNDDGQVDISDPIIVLGVLFLGDGEIPLPGISVCGIDPTEDSLTCEVYASCP